MESIQDPSDRFLAHYGIPGMKWGKKRSKSSTSSTAKKTATPYPRRERPPAVKGVTDLRPKPIKNISDKELRNRINRIQMETQYKQLTEGTAPNSSSKAKDAYAKFEKGHQVVQNVMSVAKTAQTIHKFATSPLIKDIAKIIK